MSFYRSLLVALAAVTLALPAFADETPAPAAADQAQPAAASADAAQAAPADQQGKLDVNKATVKQLVKVKGITPAKAKALVVYRKKNGDFKSLDDLKNVKGFQKLTDEQMKEIQDQLSLS